MSGRDRIPMTSGVGMTHKIWIEKLSRISCQTCKDNSYLKLTKECAKCVKFSNWKDVEG